MRVVSLVAILILAGAAPAPADGFDAAAALAKGRALQGAVRAADPAPLWAEFDPNMRAALGDSGRFAATLAGIARQVGSLDSCLGDTVARQGAYLVYLARCRFSAAPSPLRLQFAFDADGRIGGFYVRPGAEAYPSAHLDHVARTTLQPPVHGEWTVVWGGRTVEQNQHAVTRDQRFAYDLLMVRNGSTHRGDGKRVEDYWCYGSPVVAPAAGMVVWSDDGHPDQTPGTMDSAHPIGNGYVIAHGNGEFSVLAHLQPGSLRRVVGDSVAAGDTLGLCGNSGNTTEPHVHFHLQNGPRPLDADGLPAPFADVIVDGKRMGRAEPVRGQTVRRADDPAGTQATPRPATPR